MKKIINIVFLIVLLVGLISSCSEPVTKDQLFDGKTPKELYASYVKQYENHKDQGEPYSINIAWSKDGANSDAVIDLIYDGKSLKFTINENSLTEEIIYCDGLMYYTDKDGEKHLYDSDYKKVDKYLNESSKLEDFIPAFLENIPNSWFDDLEFVPSEDGKYFTVTAEPQKGNNNHPLYEEFYESDVICKLYFTIEGVLDKVELENVTIDGEKGNVTLSFSWDEDIKVDAPVDKDEHNFNGAFDPDKGHVPGDDNNFSDSGDSDEQYSTGLYFVLSDDETHYMVSSIGSCTDVNIKIPPVYNGIIVKSICDKAFAGSTIESIVLPEGIESIGVHAFTDCHLLYNITIPQSVTTIGDFAFRSCIALDSIVLPQNLKILAAELFYNCESLERIVIPDGVTSIEYSAFSGCTSLTSVEIPNSVISIEHYAFSGCTSLTSVEISDGVTSIEHYAFSGCTSLTSVEIPNSVTSIGSDAFSGCVSLTSVEIPNSVTSIGSDAFSGCTSLTSVEIPNSVTSIGSDAFSGCTTLKSMVLSKAITRSSFDNVFDNCTSLEDIYYLGTEKEWNKLYSSGSEIVNSSTIYYYSETEPTVKGNFWRYGDGIPTPWPEYVAPSNPDNDDVGSDPHVHNYQYTSIVEPTCISEGYTVHSCSCGNVYRDTFVDAVGHSFNDGYCSVCGEWDPSYTYSEGLDYGKGHDGTYYNVVGIGSCTDTEIVIPPTYSGLPVKRISNSAFSGCDSIVKVVFGSNIEGIHVDSFANCTSLKSIVVSEKVTSIKDAFAGCTSLSEIHIVDIGAWCEMDIIDFASVLSKADLYLDGKLLTEVVIPEGVTSISSNAFSGRTSITSVVIPDSVITMGGFSNCTSLKNVVLGKGLTSIENNAFYGCTSLKNIDIPNSVTTIGRSAFEACESLTNITLPNSLTKIDTRTFYNCKSLESINIPDTVTSIGNNVFFGCVSLVSIEIPDSVTSISVYSFADCTSLTTVVIGTGITTIAGNLFSGCISLVSINIPEGVTDIGSYAFSGCTSLISVEIPNSVTSIGSDAFSGCTSLTSVEIPNGVTSISSRAFYRCTSLTSIVIPNSVTRISGFAFADCTSLVSVVISKNITSSSGMVFDNCVSLKNLYCTSTKSEELDYSVYHKLLTRDGASPLTFYPFYSETEPTIEGNFWCYVDGVPTPWTEYVNPSNPDSGDSDSDPHVHNYQYTSIVEPTCILAGYTMHACSCGDVYNDTFVDAVGHSFNDGYCSVCGEWDPSYTYSEGLQYSNEGTYYSIVGIGSCTDTEIIIPPTYCGLPVRGIRGFAFRDCDSITRVVLGSNIVSIYIDSFANCTSLKSIVVSEKATNIMEAFTGCTALSEIHIVDIGAWCETSITDSDSVLSKADLYFEGKLLTDVVIPEGVTSISSNAFSGRTTITSIAISDGVKIIESGAFSNCTSLKNVTLGKGLISIEDKAFYGCTSLISLDIPDSVTTIGRSVFTACESLTNITLSNSLTKIDGNTFSRCTSLKSVNIPNTVKSINANAFSGCSSLDSVYITDIEAWCNTSFGNSTSNPMYYGANLYLNGELVTEVTIPDTVADLGYIFTGCTSIVSIIIPDSVTSIGSSAFYGCDSLTSIVIPDSVTSIGYCAFYECSNLTGVVIGDSVTSIGSSAFYNCTSLTSVVIPDSVTSIGSSAFYGCSSLTDVYYTGSEDAWKAITIDSSNYNLTSATRHYNYVPEN